MSPQSSVNGITAKVLKYNLRFRELASRPNKRFNIVVNSIIRKSFRKSSFGLHKNDCSKPCESIMISTSIGRNTSVRPPAYKIRKRTSWADLYKTSLRRLLR